MDSPNCPRKNAEVQMFLCVCRAINRRMVENVQVKQHLQKRPIPFKPVGYSLKIAP